MIWYVNYGYAELVLRDAAIGLLRVPSEMYVTFENVKVRRLVVGKSKQIKVS